MHNIQVTSHMTGISAHTLRAWEKRYQAVVPDRDSLGRRVYNDSQVEKLRNLKLLRDTGYAINEIAKLDEEKLKELAAPIEEKYRELDKESQENQKTLSLFFVDLAIKNYKLDILNHEIAKLKSELSSGDFAKKVIFHIHNLIKDLAFKGQISLDQRKAVTKLIQFHIGELVFAEGKNVQKGCAPIVIASPANEESDLLLMASALLCQELQYPYVYLGSNVEIDSLSHSLASLNTKHSIIVTENLKAGDFKNNLLNIQMKLVNSLKDDGTLYFLSNMKSECLDVFPKQHKCVSNLNELELFLGDISEPCFLKKSS